MPILHPPTKTQIDRRAGARAREPAIDLALPVVHTQVLTHSDDREF